MRRLRAITKPIQLVVDGKDPVGFFSALIDNMNLTDQIDVQDYGGVSELSHFLSALSDAPRFREVVTSIGIVRDAEASGVTSAFQSVRSAVQRPGWAAPVGPMEPAGNNPRVNVLILPDNENPGMLEDLLLRAVEEDAAMPCVDTYFECLGKEATVPSNESKARAHAFLASRARPDVSVGVAAQKDYWQLDSSIYDQVRRFLHQL